MNRKMLAAAAMTCGIGGAALAQEAAGRVAVDLTAIQADIATELGIDAATVPTVVNLPIGVAAEACGVEASTLAAGAGGTGGDSSTSTGGDGAGAGTATTGDDAATTDETADETAGETAGGTGDGAGDGDGSATGDGAGAAAGGTASDGDAAGETGDGATGDSGVAASGGATVLTPVCSATTSSQAVAQFVQTEINAGTTTP